MRCSCCGLESPLDQEFRRVPRFLSVPGVRERWKRYCPPCQERRVTRYARWTVCAYLLVLAGAVLWTTWQPDSVVPWLFFFFALSVFFLALGVVLHELGHYLSAQLLGARIFGVVIGIGEAVWKRRLGNTVFEIRILPLGGYVVCDYANPACLRLRHWLVVLGGPLAQVASLVAMVALWEIRKSLGGPMPYSLGFAGAWTLANVVLLAGALWPQRWKKLGDLRNVPNDGLALLTLPFLKVDELHTWHANYFVQEASAASEDHREEDARQWCERGLALYPTDTTLLAVLGTSEIRLGDYASGRKDLSVVLAREDLTPTGRPTILNNLAWADLMLGDPDLLAEADAYSAEAYKAKPWMPQQTGTRGAVLVTKGDLDVGLDLLRRALEKNKDPYNRAVNACYLALGEARRGNVTTALGYLETASKLDPNCPVLARIRAEVSCV